jgi:capsular exopolysaccharide synthesis family protein
VKLRDLMRAIRRHWVMILVAATLAGGSTAVAGVLVPPTYRASTVLFVSNRTNTGSGIAADRLRSYVAILKGPVIAGAVSADLRLRLNTQQIQAKLDAQVEPGTDLLVVSATDSSATRARTIVTSAAEQLIERLPALEPPSSPPVSIAVAQPAAVSRTSNHLLLALGLAVVLGLLVGVAASVIRETLLRTVDDDDDLGSVAGLASLGVVGLRTAGNGYGYGYGYGYGGAEYPPGGSVTEALRGLRTTLLSHGLHDRPPDEPISLLITGSAREKSTTAITCGLAVALAEAGWSTVLVDGNLREPNVDTYLALYANRGLADVLAGTATVEDVARQWGHDGLRVVPAGHALADPGALIASPNLQDTLRVLESRFDVVLIDGPPLLPYADAPILSTLVTDVLLVVSARRTRATEIIRAVDVLRRVDARVIGAVLHQLPRHVRDVVTWTPSRPTAANRPPRPEAAPADPLDRAMLVDSSVVMAVTAVNGLARIIEAHPAEPPGDGAHAVARGRARVEYAADGERGDTRHRDGATDR